MKKIILVFIMILSLACGSRKKALQKSKDHEKEIVVESKIEAIEIVKDSIVEIRSKSEILDLTKESQISLTQGDSNKEIIITDSKGNSTSIRGANIIISKNENSKHKKDTISNSISVKTGVKSNTISDGSSSKEKSSKKKDLQVHTKRGFPWWILIVIGLIYLSVSYAKKTVNPIAWLSSKR